MGNFGQAVALPTVPLPKTLQLLSIKTSKHICSLFDKLSGFFPLKTEITHNFLHR